MAARKMIALKPTIAWRYGIGCCGNKLGHQLKQRAASGLHTENGFELARRDQDGGGRDEA